MKPMHVGQRRRVITAGGVSLALCLLWVASPATERLARPVSVKGATMRLDAGDHISVFSSAADLGFAGSAEDIQLSSPVDFQRENLVRVSWTADGYVSRGSSKQDPPELQFTTLASAGRWAGRKILFWCREPIGFWGYGSTERAFMRVCHEDWFAVPKSARVTWAGEGQVRLLDAGFAGAMALAAIGMAVAVIQGRRSGKPSI